MTATWIRSRAALRRYLTPTMWQTGLLMGVDMLTNVTDYGFHVYLGRALVPGDFAAVQTMNSALLILVTAVAVLQPVVARYVAAARGDAARQHGVFQLYLRQSTWLGLLLSLLALAGRQPLAALLNVPVAVVTAAAAMPLLATMRPVVAGMLQGQQRFVAFGLTRTAYALGRLALAVLLVGVVGAGAVGGVAAMPLGALLALAAGLLLLGGAVWRKPGDPLLVGGRPRVPPGSRPGQGPARDLVSEGWRLSLAALLAYAAYMALLNVDLIVVNRLFGDQAAGNYATAVVFRRVLAVLPGAILVIFYPRVVERVSRGRLPDRILAKAGLAIGGANIALTAAYFLLGPWLVELLFGPSYAQAAPLLGWMGVAMIGYGLAAIWLNLFLATRPWPFVALLAAVAAAQLAALNLSVASGSLWAERSRLVLGVFGGAGWILALGGLLLYLAWLRPALSRGLVPRSDEESARDASRGPARDLSP